MTNKALKDLVRLLRKEGVVVFKNKDVELELSPYALEIDIINKNKKEDVKEAPMSDQMSAEDMLLWSAPGLPPEEG